MELLQTEQDITIKLSSQSPLSYLSQCYEPSRFLCSGLLVSRSRIPSRTRLTTGTAVVYLKNRINRGWASTDEAPVQKPIPEPEKQGVRDRLLPLLTTSPPPVRSQLEPILQKILQCDFPQKWPNFVDIAAQLLATNEAGSLYAGLQCVLSLARTYRYKSGENRAEFDRIVQVTFDQVLAIANRLLTETSIEAGEMLRTAIKCYKHAIYVRVPEGGTKSAQFSSLTSTSSSICLNISKTMTAWSAGALFLSMWSPCKFRKTPFPRTWTSAKATTGGNARNGHIAT